MHSFDYDADSVACTRHLRERYFGDDPGWTVQQGSVLDEAFMKSLPVSDIVYSWGVLHHTGAMWQAMQNVIHPVVPGGRLFLALYNDEGEKSVRWLRVKRRYNALPKFLRIPYVVLVMLCDEWRFMISPTLMMRPRRYLTQWRQYRTRWNEYHQFRGMSKWHDIIDWIGGYPFEVSSIAQVTAFYEPRGFRLEKADQNTGQGNNELVFVRER